MWTEERIELLKKLHAEGLSYGTITLRLGNGFTRNAVIGKGNRLGLKGRSGMNFSDDAMEKKLKKKQALLKRRLVAAAKSLAKAKKLATPKPEVTPGIQALIAIPTNNFMANKPGLCKWPHGDVCIRHITHHSYCTKHHERSRVRG
jgi:GcrA cell cycle regulator